MTTLSRWLATSAMLLPLTAVAALPAGAPDAGRLLREQQTPVAPPTPAPALLEPGSVSAVVAPGGAQVQLVAVRFTGNTMFTEAQLQRLVADALGRQHDLASLYALADRISAFYRERGYAFAKAMVPAQGFSQGVLTIQVIEGMYGVREVETERADHAARAREFLSPLQAGQPIYAPLLERQMLLLNDQPGYAALPVMSPGRVTGEGDLKVKLTRQNPVAGSVSLSNQGNRYTGYNLVRASLAWRSPFQFGDQLRLDLMQSDQNLRSVSLNYGMPLGHDGWRMNVGYSHTQYELAREFANLQASGVAQTVSAGVSYPLLRSRLANLTVAATGQHKRFYDEQASVGARQSKGSDSVVLSLNMDRTDASGITYGSVSLTQGRFNAPSNVADTGRVDGKFQYIAVDLVRLQRLTRQLSLYTRLNGQKAFDNLDGSESFLIGGAYGVRGYPSGEGAGDEGLLGQMELRYNRDRLQPYVFMDVGRVRLEHGLTAPGKNHRSLSATGVGVRYQYQSWNLDAQLARRLVGGVPQNDPRDDAWRLWLMLSYAF